MRRCPKQLELQWSVADAINNFYFNTTASPAQREQMKAERLLAEQELEQHLQRHACYFDVLTKTSAPYQPWEAG